jgi:hypothetical protein
MSNILASAMLVFSGFRGGLVLGVFSGRGWFGVGHFFGVCEGGAAFSRFGDGFHRQLPDLTADFRRGEID